MENVSWVPSGKKHIKAGGNDQRRGEVAPKDVLSRPRRCQALCFVQLFGRCLVDCGTDLRKNLLENVSGCSSKESPLP
jgi:hypothetical protein